MEQDHDQEEGVNMSSTGESPVSFLFFSFLIMRLLKSY